MDPTTMPTLHLLGLPAELRSLIYSFCFLPKTTKRGRKYQGTSNVLLLCKQIYNESHHVLHAPLRTLKIYRNPLTDLQPTPLFRHYKTTYKSSVGLFTASEFRRFTNIQLNIEYRSQRRDAPNGPEPLDQDVPNRMRHALRVLVSSHALEKITINLRARDPWTGTVPPSQRPHSLNQTKALLAPFLLLVGLSIKICAVNALKPDDQVVIWFNASISRRITKMMSRILNESNLNASLPAIRNLFYGPEETEQVPIQYESLHELGQLFPPHLPIYSAIERKAFMQKKQRVLQDVRRLFDIPDDIPECGKQPRRARIFKCGECLMAFESRKLLWAHKNLSIHTAKEILHNEVPVAVSDYCPDGHSRIFHFKRSPHSAFKCTTCFAKFSYLEGLKVHMEFWNHIPYDSTKTYEDISGLLDPLYEPLSTGFECQECFWIYESKNLLNQHIYRSKHVQKPTPSPKTSFPPPEQKTFRCGTCDESFPSTQELLDHFNTYNHSYRRLPKTVKGYGYNDENGERGPPIPPDRLYTCLNCDGLFETSVHLQTHIKEVNASRYAEPGHFIQICHPSIPERRPGKIFCRHPKCKMSFASKNCHGRSRHSHWNWEWPANWKWSKYVVKKKISRPFVQARLPVESTQGFWCGKCGGWWETRDLLQRHLEHREIDCWDEISGRGVM